ncbi:MAG: hypothetical protein JO159_15795 [Acidobacteria bacterium]|nr:hypothetical protein [Acidobacteriota bacterium]
MLPQMFVTAGWGVLGGRRKSAALASGRLLLLLAFFLFHATGISEQAGSEGSLKLLDIEVIGTSHLKADDVRLASGLVVGQVATKGDLEQAIERLGQTGLFSRLSYRYHCVSGGCTLVFELTENDQLVPAEFENFVWFGQNELLGLVASRVPLFNGRLPLAGRLADQVVVALDRVLAERKIPGEATCLRPEASQAAGDSSGSYLFKITHHEILIHRLDFPGAAASELRPLESAAEPLDGQPYLRTKMRDQARSNFLPIYLARGYLKASFGAPQASVIEDGARTLVDVSLAVISGRQYRLGSVQWTGNAALPSGNLQELVHLKPGAPVDALQLEADIEAIQKLYRTRGYLFARIETTPILDDARQIASYQLSVSEGDLYSMGDLTVEGLDSEAAKKLVAQWQMKKGAPFDNSYVARFFKLLYRNEGVTLSYDVVPRQSVNQQNKTVSVTLQFKPRK